MPAIVSRKEVSTKNKWPPFWAEPVLFMNNCLERVLRDLLNIKDSLAAESFYSFFKFLCSELLYSRKQPHIINEIKNKFIFIQYYLTLRYLNHNSNNAIKKKRSLILKEKNYG
ncbi:MAG: hypothetical protein ACTSRZ_07530 [Promethearchaeota archaeon]